MFDFFGVDFTGIHCIGNQVGQAGVDAALVRKIFNILPASGSKSL
jgi:hypothetical protein